LGRGMRSPGTSTNFNSGWGEKKKKHLGKGQKGGGTWAKHVLGGLVSRGRKKERGARKLKNVPTSSTGQRNARPKNALKLNQLEGMKDLKLRGGGQRGVTKSWTFQQNKGDQLVDGWGGSPQEKAQNGTRGPLPLLIHTKSRAQQHCGKQMCYFQLEAGGSKKARGGG